MLFTHSPAFAGFSVDDVSPRPRLRPVIEAVLQAVGREDVRITVGRLGTFVSGEEPAVFAALRAAVRAAGSSGPAVAVATLSTGVPSDATVAGIQGVVDAVTGVD